MCQRIHPSQRVANLHTQRTRQLAMTAREAKELRIWCEAERGRKSKYCDHVPLFRQSAMLERETGLELSRVTLCGWVMAVGELLMAIVGAMRRELLSGGYIQADETPVDVQSERTKGKNHQAYLCQYSRPGGPVVFDFQLDRGRQGPRQFLGEFAGILQTVGYIGYGQVGAKIWCMPPVGRTRGATFSKQSNLIERICWPWGS